MSNSIQRIEGGFETVSLTNAAVAQYKRIKITSTGAYQVCGLTDYGDAVLEVGGAANAVCLPSRSLSAEGEQYGIADESISKGDLLYSAADGKVSKTQGSGAKIVGRAKSDAADGQILKYNARSVA